MIKNKSNYLTTTEVADFLGFSPDHIRNLIRRGKIKGEKLGRNWIVNKTKLSKVKRNRFPRRQTEN